MQWMHDWFIRNHTAIALIVGPLILIVTFKIPRIWASAKLMLAILAIVLITGLIGLIYNAPAVIITFMLMGIKRGILLTPIRMIFRGLSILMGALVGVFLIYVLFTNPSAILKNWWNPALLLYFMPTVLFWIFADWAQEAHIEKSKAQAPHLTP